MTIREYIDSRDESIRPRLCAVYDTLRGRDLPRAPVGRAAPPAGAAARRVFAQPCGPLRGRRPADRPRVRHPGENTSESGGLLKTDRGALPLASGRRAWYADEKAP